MKTSLTLTLIRDRLRVDVKPVFKPNGTLEWKPRPPGDRAPYIVFDTNQDAPTGFGVKVGKRLTFVLQRRAGDKVVKVKVGNVSDFDSLEAARRRAKEVALKIEDTGENPNTAAKAQAQAEREQVTAAKITLANAFELYRHHLVNRQKRPAKESSLKNYDLAARRLERDGVDLLNKTLGWLAKHGKVIVDAFDTLANSPRPPHPNLKNKPARVPKRAKPGEGIRTAAEQTFRWASAAAQFAITLELDTASLEGRDASLARNPFEILKSQERFRDRIELEKAYAKSAARNPLSIQDGSLGRFLNAVWLRRQIENYKTACDYLLLTLLWGTRRGEAAPLMWRDQITAEQAKMASWVDLNKRVVHFHDTKNHSDLDLPIAPGAYEILTQRREGKIPVPKHQRKWVFPARSSRAVQGHYLDSKAILTGLRKTAKIDILRTHDLRRTFGAVAESMTSYAIVKRLLNHKSLSDPTERYTKPEEPRVVEAMERIERAMLETAPLVATALLPLPGKEG
jgi:integrase